MDIPAVTVPKKFFAKEKNLGIGDYAAARFQLKVENDVPLEALLRPAFWVNVHQRLAPGNRLEIISEDYMLDVDARVIGVKDQLVTINVLRAWEHPARAARLRSAGDATDASPLPELPPDYKIGHAGSGWWARMKDQSATSRPIASNLKTELDAINASIDHAKRAGLPLTAAKPEPTVPETQAEVAP